jgi:hypothetical protein
MKLFVISAAKIDIVSHAESSEAGKTATRALAVHYYDLAIPFGARIADDNITGPADSLQHPRRSPRPRPVRSARPCG